jgi:hypothetical protein
MLCSSVPPVDCRNTHIAFTLFVFVCVLWCPTHIALCFCFVFLYLVYPMLSVSLDCPFWLLHSVFSNVYLIYSNIWKEGLLLMWVPPPPSSSFYMFLLLMRSTSHDIMNQWLFYYKWELFQIYHGGSKLHSMVW